MKRFLVGGAVRDALLGLPVTERDWVVIDATPNDLIALGYRPVGRDFPVFLHPRTHEEHALARTERKTAPGYRGFNVHTGPDVSLQDDLLRRDLTINAMAQDENGDLIDPYGGREDLRLKCLRHVSPAFREDPVRILRTARFMARYARLGFRVADETLDLMQTMVDAGEAAALVPERVWAELDRSLAEPTPSAFFATLRACGALKPLFPELDSLFGVPQPPEHHPEVDTGIHTLLVLDQAAKLTNDAHIRFAALTHDLGKALTPKDILPKHTGHEAAGLAPLGNLCKRLRVPNAYRRLARQVMLFHGLCHKAFELRPATLVDLLQKLGALHESSDMEAFLVACEADARGRTGFEDRPYPQADWLRSARKAALSVDSAQVVESGLTGMAFGDALRRMRIGAVASARGERASDRPSCPTSAAPLPGISPR